MPIDMNNIAEQLSVAYQNLTEKCLEYGLHADSVQLIAVSKTKPVSDIIAAYQAGQRQFGENYPQELAEKSDKLHHCATEQYADIQWHFIGPLQSNKTKLVADHAHWVHSIDRLKIAKRLSEQRPAELSDLNVLLQINISNEVSKSGIAADDMLTLAHQVAALPRLQLKGLMAIPAAAENGGSSALSIAFGKMQQLSQLLQKHYPQATELSMGMSSDWPLALRYGATMIRLGTAIFGERDYKKDETTHE